MSKQECATCVWEKATGNTIDSSKSNVEWAIIIGVSEASVRRHFKHVTPKTPDDIPANAKWVIGNTEFEGDSPASTTQLGVDDVRKFIASKGLNPDEWDYTWRFSEWEQASKLHGVRTLNAFKVSGKRKPATGVSFNIDELPDAIRDFKFGTKSGPKNKYGASQIVMATDFQLGKTDWNGGTEETVLQVMSSFERVLEMADDNSASEIVVVDGGDIIENFYNTSSQRQTNDRSLPAQVFAALQLMLAGLKMFNDAGYKVRYVAVPSNHGADKIAKQSPAGAVHDDWGITIAKIIGMVTDIEVIIPDEYHVSVAFEANGTMIGVVHGDQCGSPDRIGNWWQGQSHGGLPVAKCDILLVGHWHSARVQQSGNKKWIIVGSASDRGSSWFTNIRGEQSLSGMTTFMARDRMWNDLRIL